MNLNIPQLYYSKLMRAVVEFDMIHDGDHILLGISGGKDSISLAYAMAILKKRLNKQFKLSALTINPQFKDAQGRPALFDIERAKGFMAELDIPYEIIDVDIAGTIATTPDKNPCYTCAFFRRGAVNRYAMEHDVNKIAYAHHHDDAVETFFMSLLYSGQLTTFLPVTYLDRTGLTVIRPLIYFREKEIQDAEKYHGCTPVPSPCPLDGKTIRQTTKELIAALSKDNPLLYTHLASAMRKSSLGELWPAAKTRDEMRETYHNLHAVLRH